MTLNARDGVGAALNVAAGQATTLNAADNVADAILTEDEGHALTEGGDHILLE